MHHLLSSVHESEFELPKNMARQMRKKARGLGEEFFRLS